MNWTKLLYVLIIILLYIPMAFLGVNVFFPEYTGQNNYYQYKDCYMQYPQKMNMTDAEQQKYTDDMNKCNDENRAAEKKFNDDKNAYEGKKYVMVSLFNLAILLIALFIPMIDSVVMGLFLGSMSSTFAATIRYFDARSKVGFVILVITFFIMLYFINKKKDTFMDWKTKEQKQLSKKRK